MISNKENFIKVIYFFENAHLMDNMSKGFSTTLALRVLLHQDTCRKHVSCNFWHGWAIITVKGLKIM